MVMGSLLVSFLIAGNAPVELERLVKESRAKAVQMPDNGGLPQELLPNGDAISGFGEQAIPLVLPLLKDPNPVVRRLFGSVIARLPGLTDRELPALIAAHRGGNGWVSGAIVSIGTPRAISFLASEFERAPDANKHLATELAQLGLTGVQALLAPLSQMVPVRSHFAESACEALRGLGEGARAVRAELLAVLASDKRPLANRKHSLRLLGCVAHLSADERASVDAAVMANRDLRREETTKRLQMTLGTPEGVRIATGRLAKDPEYVGVLVVAGQSARVAEPEVIALLEHPAAVIRLEATKTLGAIGGEASIARLEAALSEAGDWRVPCAAARSLTTLKAASKAAALRSTARTAWYPPTAQCIDAARAALEGGKEPPPQDRSWDVPDGTPWRLKSPPRAASRPEEFDESHRQALRVTGAVRSWGEKGLYTQNVVGTPSAALAVDGGVLLGTNRGEWGGELVWLPGNTRGKQIPLLEENIVGIHRLGSQPVVVTGLGHLGINEGAVYRVEFTPDGGARAIEWRILPGVPERSFVLDDGRLFLPCSGGDVVLDASGNLALATQELVK